MVGDVSWICPTAQIHAATCSRYAGTFLAGRISGKIFHGHKGMLFAGKVMALAAMRLMEDPALLKKAREMFEEDLQGQRYIPIPDEVAPRAMSSFWMMFGTAAVREKDRIREENEMKTYAITIARGLWLRGAGNRFPPGG